MLDSTWRTQRIMMNTNEIASVKMLMANLADQQRKQAEDLKHMKYLIANLTDNAEGRRHCFNDMFFIKNLI